MYCHELVYILQLIKYSQKYIVSCRNHYVRFNTIGKVYKIRFETRKFSESKICLYFGFWNSIENLSNNNRSVYFVILIHYLLFKRTRVEYLYKFEILDFF